MDLNPDEFASNDDVKKIIEKEASNVDFKFEGQPAQLDDENEVFECYECGNCLLGWKSYGEHMSIHEMEAEQSTNTEEQFTEFECNVCRAFFKGAQDFQDHMEAHVLERLIALEEKQKEEDEEDDDDEWYYIEKTTIKTKHEIKPDLVAKVKENPKALDSNIPSVKANFYAIYDMDTDEIVHSKLPTKRA